MSQRVGGGREKKNRLNAGERRRKKTVAFLTSVKKMEGCADGIE